MVDPYKILGVDYAATDSEDQRAYHTLARKYHPDNYASDPEGAELANRKMREINAAYEKITADRAKGITGADAYREPPEKKAPPTTPHTAPRTAAWNPAGTAHRPFVGYATIREMINAASFAVAYGELCHLPSGERDAEWHYLAGLAHVGMHHIHNAMQELNTACRMDKKNAEYKKAREELLRRGSAPADTSARFSGAAPKEKKSGGPIKRFLLRLFGLDEGL